MKKMISYRLEPVTTERIVKISEATGMSQAETVELCVSHVYDLFRDMQEADGESLIAHDARQLARLFQERMALMEEKGKEKQA